MGFKYWLLGSELSTFAVNVKGAELPVIRHIIAATNQSSPLIGSHPSVSLQHNVETTSDTSGLIRNLETLVQRIEALKASQASPSRTKKLHALFEELRIPEEIKSGICEEIGRKAGKQQAPQQRAYGKEHFADSFSALQTIIREAVGKLKGTDVVTIAPVLPAPSRTGAGGIGQAHVVRNTSGNEVGNRVDSTDIDYSF